MKKSGIKRALVSSAIALVICFAMLLGTTFAWFTDNATTAVNTIQAGKLDIALLDAQGSSLEGETLSFVNANGGEIEEGILWEPGCTYYLEPVTVANNGNLALKFKLEVSGLDGDAKLLEALEWQIDFAEEASHAQEDGEEGQQEADEEYHLLPRESKTLVIAAHMKEEAGNEYQELKLEGIAVTVYATQDTVEYDSFDNQYDADAEYFKPLLVTANTIANPDWYDADAAELYINTPEDLVAFQQAAYTWGVADRVNVPDFAGVTIYLNEDFYFEEGMVWTPISPYDSTYLSNGGFKGTFDGQGHTLYNLNVTHQNATGRGYRMGFFGEVGAGATFKNLTLDGVNTYAGNTSAGALVALAAGDVTFENITVRNATIRQGRASGGIVGDVRANVTFKNCAVENSAVFSIHNKYRGALYGILYADQGTATIENCTVTNTVSHYFSDGDWNTFQHISLADALVSYASEPAANGMDYHE